MQLFGCIMTMDTIFKALADPTRRLILDRLFREQGQTLGQVIDETEALTGRRIERAYVDKGYRGHNAPKRLRVYKSGQKRGVHGQIKKELRRRSAIEAVIGHCKSDGHLGRNFLKGCAAGSEARTVTSSTPS